MSYCGYVTTLKNVRTHPNADRMKLADCFGNTVCVGLDAKENDIVVYFPVDGQLSVEYCAKNDLVRRKDENGNPAGGYLDPDKRNIRALKLRGEKSDGLTMPLESFAYTGVDMSSLTIGTTITVVNGHEICQKYIPRTCARPASATGKAGNRTRKHKEPIAPLFQEHADTEQLAYNHAAFKPGDEIEITLKMHGTSQRTGYLPILSGHKDSFVCRAGNAMRHILNKMGVYHGENKHDGTPIYDWGYVSGTRRVVLDSYDGGFYGSNEFREQHAKAFEGKLWKGETVYYEVVGFTHTGTSIMSEVSNNKVSDKEFTKRYGKTTVFSYGCSPTGWFTYPDGSHDQLPQSDFYVYRMTLTNEDGQVIEYTPDFMRYRCEQMGVKTVPVLARFIIPEYYELPDAVGSLQAVDAGEYVTKIAEKFYDGPDPVGKTHIREGVVIRILNRPKFTAYKHKNFYFKVLEGLAKDTATAPDMEEASGLEEEINNE